MAKSAKKKAAKPAKKKAVKKVSAKKPAKVKKAVAKKVKKVVAKKAAPKKQPKKTVKPVAKTVVKKEVKPVVVVTKPAPSQLNIFPIINQRPIAHKPAKPSTMSEDKTRYSDDELKEFEVLINGKLDKAREEFKIL